MVLFGAGAEDRQVAEESGLTILAEDGAIAVAERSIHHELKLQ